jgi:hypothetical protein
MGSWSEFTHALLVLLLARCGFVSCFCRLSCKYLLLWRWDLLSLNKVRVVLQEGFNASREKECVLVALFAEHLRVLRSLALIIHVDDYQLVWLISKAVQFRYRFISPDIRRWEVDRFFNAPKVILIRVPQVK